MIDETKRSFVKFAKIKFEGRPPEGVNPMLSHLDTGGGINRVCFVSVTTKRARIYVFAVEYDDHYKWMSLFYQKKWLSGMTEGPELDFDR